MLRKLRFIGICAVAGIIVGFVVVGGLWLWHRSRTSNLASPSGAPADGSASGSSLSVVGQGDQGMLLGDASQGSASGSSSGGADNAAPSSTPSANGLPGPSDFSQYDKYKNQSTALYQDVEVGSGAAVAKGSSVTVQYRAYLTNGTQVDNTYDKGKPFTFTEGSGSVIPGWEEGIFGMKAGGERRIIIPPSLAYGVDGKGSIPGNSVLIFDVSLISVQ